MEFVNVLQFIWDELKQAVDENSRERASELGSAIDVLFEASGKFQDKKTGDVLLQLNYIVFHFEEHYSFAQNYLSESKEMISKSNSLQR